MGLVTFPTVWIAKQLLTATALNGNFNALANQVNGNLDASNLADLAVTTPKIAVGAVTGPKILMGSDAQGDTLYFNGAQYVRLPAGTAGQVLLTGGAGANPSWTNVGKVLQQVLVLDQVARAITAAVFPNDTTIPQFTEGADYPQLQKIFTPKSATSTLIIECIINCSQNGGAGFRATQAVLFVNGASDANGKAMGVNRQAYDAGGSGYETVSCSKPVAFTYSMPSGGVIPITFNVRLGATEGTAFVNVDAASNNYTYGNILSSSLKITEVGA